jgi:CRP-like cAMP-binding protein
MLVMLSREYYKQSETLVCLGCLPAIDRLKQLLYEITAEVQRSSDLHQRVKIQVPLKHLEMAQMIAITPEHLCRLLNKLEEEKIITRDKGSLIVNDTQRLKQGCGL